MRGILACVFTGLFCVLSSAPARSVDAPARQIAVIVYSMAPEHTAAWLEGANDHPAVRDGSVVLTVYTGEGSQFVHDSQISDISSRDYDAFVLVDADLGYNAKLVAAAVKRGIPVVASCGRFDVDGVAAFVGFDDERGGYLAARALFERLEGKGNVVLLKGPDMQDTTLRRELGVATALREFPDITLLDARATDWSMGESSRVMQEWMVRFQDQVDGVVALSDEMGLGAVMAMRGAGEAILPVSGIDGIPEAVQAVADGGFAQTLYKDPRAEAQGALDVTLRQLLGPDYQPLGDCWKDYPDMRWNGGMDKLYFVPWTVIR